MLVAESIRPVDFSLIIFPSDNLSLFINNMLGSIQLWLIILDSREFFPKMNLSHPQPWTHSLAVWPHRQSLGLAQTGCNASEFHTWDEGSVHGGWSSSNIKCDFCGCVWHKRREARKGIINLTCVPSRFPCLFSACLFCQSHQATSWSANNMSCILILRENRDHQAPTFSPFHIMPALTYHSPLSVSEKEGVFVFYCCVTNHP